MLILLISQTPTKLGLRQTTFIMFIYFDLSNSNKTRIEMKSIKNNALVPYIGTSALLFCIINLKQQVL